MTIRFCTIVASVVALTFTAAAQEKKIERSALPAAVEKAVQAETKGTDIKGFAEEREHGKIFYEVETISNGHARDVLFAADGTIAEIEEEVAFDSLHPDVQAGLRKKAAGAPIQKVESLTKKGKLVAYEAVIKRSGKSAEIQVGPDGQGLAHEQ